MSQRKGWLQQENNRIQQIKLNSHIRGTHKQQQWGHFIISKTFSHYSEISPITFKCALLHTIKSYFVFHSLPQIPFGQHLLWQNSCSPSNSNIKPVDRQQWIDSRGDLRDMPDGRGMTQKPSETLEKRKNTSPWQNRCHEEDMQKSSCPCPIQRNGQELTEQILLGKFFVLISRCTIEIIIIIKKSMTTESFSLQSGPIEKESL